MVRRRLRSYLWRQWQNGHNRFNELRRRGVPKFHAAVAAGSPTGFWRMSGHGGIIEINLMALTNSAKREKQVIVADIPGMAAFGPCVRVGEFLFPSGLMAIDRDGQ